MLRAMQTSIAVGQSRLEEMKSYVRQEVARLFRGRTERGQRMSRQNAAPLASGVIQTTFQVFEECLLCRSPVLPRRFGYSF
jgi:hypothetical protein